MILGKLFDLSEFVLPYLYICIMVLGNYTEFFAVWEIIGVKPIVTLPENQFKMSLCGEWEFLETLNLV